MGSAKESKRAGEKHGKKKDTKSSGKERPKELAKGESAELQRALADFGLLQRRILTTRAQAIELQAQFDELVATMVEMTSSMQTATAQYAALPAGDATTDAARELRQRMEQMLVAQQRTNELLDLALRVAVDADEPRRPGT